MLLSITLSNNQTLYQFLHATETPLAIVAEPNKLNELLTSYGLESLDLSDEDTQKEITFVKFLKDEYGDNFTDTLYWDYRDDLSATSSLSPRARSQSQKQLMKTKSWVVKTASSHKSNTARESTPTDHWVFPC